MMLSVPSLKILPILVLPISLAAIHLFEVSNLDNNMTGSLPMKFEPGEQTFGLGECTFLFQGTVSHWMHLMVYAVAGHE
jgi:hypothetical protein